LSRKYPSYFAISVPLLFPAKLPINNLQRKSDLLKNMLTLGGEKHDYVLDTFIYSQLIE